MRKVRYKDVSPEMASIADPKSHLSSRGSVGMEEKIGEYYYLDVEKLYPYKKQARRNFDLKELEELASTIKEYGIRQPLTVVSSLENQDVYEVISGERRLRAAKMIGLKSVPCLIVKNQEEKAEEIAIVENIQRSDLHPVELAEAYYQVISKMGYGGITEFSKKVGKPISSISETIKLHSLPEKIKDYLLQKNLRSKILLRKLVKFKDLDEMETYLGFDKNIQTKAPKSVLRVKLENGDFFFESNSIVSLSIEQKEKFKKFILSFLEDF